MRIRFKGGDDLVDGARSLIVAPTVFGHMTELNDRAPRMVADLAKALEPHSGAEYEETRAVEILNQALEEVGAEGVLRLDPRSYFSKVVDFV